MQKRAHNATDIERERERECCVYSTIVINHWARRSRAGCWMLWEEHHFGYMCHSCILFHKIEMPGFASTLIVPKSANKGQLHLFIFYPGPSVQNAIAADPLGNLS